MTSNDLENQSHGSKIATPKSYSSSTELALLSLIMFTCFGIHNLLQEAIMKTPGFTFGMMLGYMEVLGVTICSYLERKYIKREKGRNASISSYSFLTICLLTSSALSNLSLNFINFPTKVIFRSCKLIPTMIIATFVNKRIFSSIEYICALSISLGLIIFTVVDWTLAPVFHPLGILFVSISVFADAILPNMQEHLFRIGSSRLEVTFFTNYFTLIMMTITSVMSGDMMNLIKLVLSDENQKGFGMLSLYMTVYTFISYVAVSSFMLIVKKYGGVTAVLLGTARKAMTLILSFCFFPKAFSIYYVVGTVLVLGGLLVGSIVKQQKKKQFFVKSQESIDQTFPSNEKDNQPSNN
jgi:adenosine 3'-phospho 5'-phosphosulfate transporter B3